MAVSTTDDEGDLLEDLVKEVQESLSDDGKLLSLVVASGEFESTDDGITQDALDYGDFINVMALGSRRTMMMTLHSSSSRCASKLSLIGLLVA